MPCIIIAQLIDDYFNTISKIEFVYILIPSPTSEPTQAISFNQSPTPDPNKPTPPTFSFCNEIDYDSNLIIVASNEYYLNRNGCIVMQRFRII